MTLFLTLIGWLFIAFIIIADYQTLKKNQKLKKELHEMFKQLDEGVSLYQRKSQLAGLTLKKANHLHTQIQKEHQHIKATNQFMNHAIKEKVNKKKIRGKRRRKTA